jgi:diguanylate cyclase (GGDEF)-like protein
VIRTIRQWWRQPDHYYWVTAILAARGVQPVTSRLVAALILVLGALPVILIWSPAGPHGTRDQALSVAAGVCSLVVALYWLRRRWPTRRQSLLFAVLLTLCVTVTSLTRHSAAGALTTTTTFAAVGAYIAFFHTARYLFGMLAAVAAAVAYAAVEVALSGDVIWAIRLVTAVVVVIVAVSAVTHALVHLLGVDDCDTDTEPVTGLPNRDAFYDATGAFIASRSRLDDRYLVLLVIDLDNFTLLPDTAHANRARVSVAQALRETTRHDTVVAHVGDSEFVIADSFVSADASPLVERVRSSIRSTPLRMTASVGVVVTPVRELATCPPYDLLDELVALATTAMSEARGSGGNRANYVQCARPATLDDYPERDCR